MEELKSRPDGEQEGEIGFGSWVNPLIALEIIRRGDYARGGLALFMSSALTLVALPGYVLYGIFWLFGRCIHAIITGGR
jgi:hypothetical protein